MMLYKPWCRSAAVLLLALSLSPLSHGTPSTGTGSVRDRFPAAAGSNRPLHAAVRDPSSGRVFVGSVDWLYVLNETLDVLSGIPVGPKEDNVNCDPDPSRPCTEERVQMNSTVQALVLDPGNEVVIGCSDRYYGYCFKIPAGGVNNKGKSYTIDEEVFLPIAGNRFPPVLHVGPGIRSTGVLYVGTTHGTGRPLYKDRVPMLAVRELDGFNIAHVDLVTASSIDLLADKRENFDVHYRSAFSHGQYTYFLLVRPTIPDAPTPTYRTYVARLCNKDERFQSYIEMALECSVDGRDYTLLQDAYVGKPGKELGRLLGLTPTDDMLFGVFGESVGGSMEAGPRSAVCVYSMASIAENILNSIKLCFAGRTKLGPAHLATPLQCTRMDMPIGEDYCMEADINYPIDAGRISKAMAVYPVDRPLTSINVKLTSESLHTLAVLGTADGKILQASIDDKTTLRIFSESDLGSRDPVLRDMFFDATQDHIYAMTQAQISRVKIHADCSALKTCDECLAANDPHCGWCTMDHSCMERKDCSEADNDYGWLPYNHEKGCPVILDQDPKIVQYDYASTTMITLKLNFLPADLTTRRLQCAVQGYGETRKSNGILDILANKIVCEPFTVLPNLPEGQAHLSMELSVLVYSTPWISSRVTFYECGALRQCVACALAGRPALAPRPPVLPCRWCLEAAQCQPTTAKCLADDYSSLRLRRQAPPTATAISPGQLTTLIPAIVVPEVQSERQGTLLTDPDLCPVAAADKPQFLTPAGYTAKLKLYARNLRDFQLQNLKCNFDIGSGLVVNATHQYISTDDKYLVECNPTRFSYNSDDPYVDAAFDISWDTDKFLDNTAKIHVRVFKCSAMESSCGRCSLLDPVYRCGWCDGQCLQKEECTTTWLPRNSTCPDAQITDFSPKSGSVSGGTNVTIRGVNLGKKEEDISKVTVAGVECLVIRGTYNATESFTCRTRQASQGHSGPIAVVISDSVRAVSQAEFSFVDPVLAEFSPRRGPVAGGTRVVVSGTHLDLGSKIEVKINGRDCPVVWRNFTQLAFLSAPQDRPMQEKPKVTVDGNEENILGEKFIYVVNPTLSAISPNTLLLSGGTNITVTGRNLDSVAAPKLRVKVNDLTKITTGCVGVSSTTLLCQAPALLSYGLSPTPSAPHPLHYGLVMDGVLPLRNVSHRENFGPLLVYPDPVLEPLDMPVKYSDDLVLIIKGEKLEVFSSVDKLTVSVGDEECVTQSITNTQITCKPPPDIKALDKDGNAEIKVHHGLFYTSVGHLSYAGGGSSVGLVITFIVLGLIFLVGIILIAFFLGRRECRRRRKKTMPPPPQELGGSAGRYADPRDKSGAVGGGGGGPGLAGAGGVGSAAEMTPLKTVDDDYYTDGVDQSTGGKLDGKPFQIEDLLERVKSNRLKNSIKEVLIPRERLDLGEIIGRGHFGCVYAAYLRDENMVNPQKVAVKTLQAYSLGDSFNQQSVELFLKEGVTMKNFEHLHVLQLLGVCFDEEAQPMVILPYMAKGDLRSYVKDKKNNFTARQLLQLGRQVAEGMSYLASLNFVHRDLAARNCMIDEHDNVKVADFGLSRELYGKDYYSSKDLDRRGKMPIKWMALESLEDFVFTTKSDVWSFGVLMWELMMRGVTPYPDVDVFDVRNFLASGRRLRKPKYCPDNIYQIMLDCWNAQPILRPSFTDLVNRIELMLNPTARSPKPPSTAAEADEPEQIYMNLSRTDAQDYLHPVDNTDGSVSFKPSS